MVEKRGKIVQNDGGITYTINRYVDVQREYSQVSGEKKSKILAEYSEAKQRNIIASAILKIANDLGVDGSEIEDLRVMKQFIESI